MLITTIENTKARLLIDNCSNVNVFTIEFLEEIMEYKKLVFSSPKIAIRQCQDGSYETLSISKKKNSPEEKFICFIEEISNNNEITADIAKEKQPNNALKTSLDRTICAIKNYSYSNIPHSNNSLKVNSSSYNHSPFKYIH
ncbi:hypothetical protein H8356DRAFT_1078660 [Neocallimastix lanati (nom. inval.)]|nr:hypothetical protein H8356DRAFT_1078660 [Neocallimastix sp. JGI-2020a]